MIGAYLSLVLVVGASLVVGHAIALLCSRREPPAWAPAVGLAVLLGVAATAIRLPGHATTALIVLVVLVAAAGLAVASRRPAAYVGALAPALPAALVAALAASIPFIAAGKVGILGVGLVNDDMAYHLLLGSWLDERFLPEPVLVDQGYPLGPHSLAAALALGPADLIEAFAGLTLAIPVLAAITAHTALTSLRPLARTLAAAATSLPYLAAAYLAQEAFKEPIMALFLLAFALALPGVRRGRDAIPLGLIAAGTVYVYSFPGLAWLMGTAVIWGAIELVRAGERRHELLRRALLPLGIAGGVLLAAILIDLERVRDFADFRALDPDRANEGGLGNLHGHLSPLEVLGIWPTSEFRLSAGAGSLPAAAFYAGALLAGVALALATPRWLRRHGPAIPAALLTAALLYIAARAFGTVYTSAKALAIAAPLITLITLGGLLDARRRILTALAAAVLLGLGISSFLVLRQAPVGPTAHVDELAQVRPLVQGERVLFLGRDNFVSYELRGAKPYTHVRNFYDPYFVEPNFELKDVGSKFDFDSVTADRLETFPYVITTRAAYGSGPPPDYDAVLQTDNYVLWRQRGSVRERLPAETGARPTGRLRCGGRQDEGGLAAIAAGSPVVASGWALSATLEDGGTATSTLDLMPGRWFLSLRYDATRPVTITGPGLETELPGNLDYRGTAAFWPAGEVDSDGGSVEIAVSVEDPPVAGRVLGASSVAHLGALIATPASGQYTDARPPFPGAGERLRGGHDACGREVDWIEVAP